MLRLEILHVPLFVLSCLGSSLSLSCAGAVPKAENANTATALAGSSSPEEPPDDNPPPSALPDEMCRRLEAETLRSPLRAGGELVLYPKKTEGDRAYGALRFADSGRVPSLLLMGSLGHNEELLARLKALGAEAYFGGGSLGLSLNVEAPQENFEEALTLGLRLITEPDVGAIEQWAPEGFQKQHTTLSRTWRLWQLLGEQGRRESLPAGVYEAQEVDALLARSEATPADLWDALSRLREAPLLQASFVGEFEFFELEAALKRALQRARSSVAPGPLRGNDTLAVPSAPSWLSLWTKTQPWMVAKSLPHPSIADSAALSVVDRVLKQRLKPLREHGLFLFSYVGGRSDGSGSEVFLRASYDPEVMDGRQRVQDALAELQRFGIREEEFRREQATLRRCHMPTSDEVLLSQLAGGSNSLLDPREAEALRILDIDRVNATLRRLKPFEGLTLIRTEPEAPVRLGATEGSDS